MKTNEKRRDLLEWVCIFAGPVVWLLQFLINYASVRLACEEHSRLVLHLTSFMALVIIGTAELFSVTYFLELRRKSVANLETYARRQFMAWLGLFTNGLYFLAVVAQAIPGFILDPCQK